MIKIILAHNYFDPKGLIDVISDMQKMGAPKIRIVHFENNVYQAIEGCHRLRAAAALGVTPDFEELDGGTLRSEVDGLDYDDGNDPSTTTVNSIGDWENTTLTFED